jgi:hypothetical protein
MIFNNQPNKIPVRISAFGGGCIGGGAPIPLVITRLRLNATNAGTAFIDIDSGNSVIEVSTTGTYTVGTGQELLTFTSGGASNAPTYEFIPQGTYDIILLPGDTLTITSQRFFSGSQVVAGIAWEERF